MISDERQLAAIAAALLPPGTQLTRAERNLVPRNAEVSKKTLIALRREIRAGEDPLGETFTQIRSPEIRREQGATYTPTAIVDAMIDWAADQAATPHRVVDPGAGSGRFILAAGKAFPKAALVAVDIDPLATLMLRANAAVLKLDDRLTVALTDFRSLDLPQIDGPTLFIGNPPYVRHHDIHPAWKTWLGETAGALGFTASGLAGLHIHFFVRTRQIARPGDFGAYITAAEWMDVNYGSVLRKMLADGLGGTAVHVIDPKARPFVDALTTGAITCFRVGNRPDQLTIRTVDFLDQLAPLTAGRPLEWSSLESAPKWSILVRKSRPPQRGEIELGELFKVHRGQVTGGNAVWIAGPEAAKLPARFLFPCITKGRELIAAGDVLSDPVQLRRVIDLPVDLDILTLAERKAVDAFLKWARKMEADKGFIASHRRAWWSVGLKKPAPILCTYMARRAPAFVRNHAEARHINVAHGLYPIEPLSDAALDAIARHLRETACMSAGRTYAGGLVKFEPGEVSRLHIPEPSAIAAV